MHDLLYHTASCLRHYFEIYDVHMQKFDNSTILSPKQINYKTYFAPKHVPNTSTGVKIVTILEKNG